MSTTAGRFTESAMRQALASVADRTAIDASDAVLLRLTNNAVFALPQAGLVVRVTRSHRLQARVHKVASLGAWFNRREAPTIRLADQFRQPVLAGNLLATIWAYLPQKPPRPDAGDLGHALRDFHRLGLPEFELPRWDPIGDARTRIADAEALADTDRDYLLTWCDRLEPRLAAFAAASEPGLVHADAHEGNLLREPDGGVVLCDFDATCVGPRQVDLVPAPANEARFGGTGGHSKLAAAYGVDITANDYWPLLREARDLKMIAAGVPLLASAPGVGTEFRLRLDSVRDRDDSVRWTPYGDVSRSGS
jgi:hypothetical protein